MKQPRPVIRVVMTESNIMAHLPSGEVRFLGNVEAPFRALLDTVRFIYRAECDGFRTEFEDATR